MSDETRRESDLEEIGALWTNTSKKGTKYMSGKVRGQKVLLFRNTRKKRDTEPDVRVFLAPDRNRPVEGTRERVEYGGPI